MSASRHVVSVVAWPGVHEMSPAATTSGPVTSVVPAGAPAAAPCCTRAVAPAGRNAAPAASVATSTASLVLSTCAPSVVPDQPKRPEM